MSPLRQTARGALRKLPFGLLCFLPGLLISQSSIPGRSIHQQGTMVVGVAHDDSVMGGGISSKHEMAPGVVDVEPIAWINPQGEWKKLTCVEYKSPECMKFDSEYLSKPHNYSVVSADGRDAIVHVDHMALDDECFGIGGQGTFTGGPIRYAAVAAESPDIFTLGESAKKLPEQEAEPVRKALAIAVGNKLDSTKELRVYSLHLDGKTLFVIQRAFQDWASKPAYRSNQPNFDEVFAIGAMEKGRFKLLFWKENTGDDNEQILGLIHLKSGRDFLVTSSNNPEGNSFRVYGIREGKIILILEGGGGEC